jgi:hypothetical protein
MNETRIKLRADEKQKCTTEQFWAVATFLGVNGFLLAREPLFPAYSPCWVIIPITLLDALAIIYIFRRARAYAQSDRRIQNLFEDKLEDDGVAAMGLGWRDIWGGTGLYSLLILFSWMAVVAKYCHDKV